MYSETARWHKQEAAATYTDTMYVILYNTKAEPLDEYVEDFKQEDGFARTIMFVRSDDFVNW